MGSPYVSLLASRTIRLANVQAESGPLDSVHSMLPIPASSPHDSSTWVGPQVGFFCFFFPVYFIYISLYYFFSFF